MGAHRHDQTTAAVVPTGNEAGATREIHLGHGTITYVDTGGDGPAIVFLHGLLMDATLWDLVIDELRFDHRCIAPNLPLGAHHLPMPTDADLSLPGIARLATEFITELGLNDVTVVGNDTGGALVQLMATEPNSNPPARICLVSCEAFDNIPPGLTGKTVVTVGRLPPSLFGLFMQQLRLRPFRRLPIAFGWLTKRGDKTTARWLKPLLTNPSIRVDAIKVLRAIGADRDLLHRAAERLPRYHGRALVVWATEDRVMPPAHGRRLAELLGGCELVEVNDSYTLIPLDQPTLLANSIRSFLQG
jgi:pimeloyl-ACP methyl ester carboxylesterase